MSRPPPAPDGPRADAPDETPAPHCPLCGRHNRCGFAAGQTGCWCFSVPVPESLVERVPEILRGVVCVCEDCIRAHAASAPDPR